MIVEEGGNAIAVTNVELLVGIEVSLGVGGRLNNMGVVEVAIGRQSWIVSHVERFDADGTGNQYVGVVTVVAIVAIVIRISIEDVAGVEVAERAFEHGMVRALHNVRQFDGQCFKLNDCKSERGQGDWRSLELSGVKGLYDFNMRVGFQVRCQQR